MTLEEKIYDIIVDVQNECYHECAYMDSVKVNMRIAKRLIENGMIMLPCPIGSPVYFIIKNCSACHFLGENSCGCFCDRNPRGDMYEDDIDKGCKYRIVEDEFDYSMLGYKNHEIFLSKQEAEKSLEERMNGNA